MGALLACPFCRQLFPEGESATCPECGVGLQRLEKLPPSHEVQAELAAETPPPAPEDRRLPLHYWRRGRGALALLCLLGLACFFAPWVLKTMPDIETLSAFDLAQRRAGWLWGGAVAWFILFPLVVSRRSVFEMRGVRIVCVLFASMTLVEVLTLLALPPSSRGRVPVEFQWGWGLYASAVVSLLGVLVAARFGGSLDDIESAPYEDAQGRKREETSAGETLH